MTHIILVVGYLASLLLAFSLLVNNDLKFRWLNTLGCLCFIAYGILINALPIIITNSLLLLINLFYLIKLYRTDEDFDLIEFKGNERLVHKFLSFYKSDINHYFPDYKQGEDNNALSFVVLRDLVIANIFVATLTIIHHAWLFLLEAWQFGNIWYFLAKTLLSTAISLLLIIITELLFVRKQKFKTNTV